MSRDDIDDIIKYVDPSEAASDELSSLPSELLRPQKSARRRIYPELAEAFTRYLTQVEVKRTLRQCYSSWANSRVNHLRYFLAPGDCDETTGKLSAPSFDELPKRLVRLLKEAYEKRFENA